MSKTSPTISEWKELYQLASDFKTLKCWEYMLDLDVFGVKDPESGNIGYCCVLGNREEFFALAVYNDAKGLGAILKMHREDFQDDDPDMAHMQDCWMVSFEDKKQLEDEDISVLGKCGIKFSGDKWTMFRRYEPGYPPWFINKEDARFLTVVLEQAIDVAKRYKDSDVLLPPLLDEKFLVRTVKGEGKKLKWIDEILKLESMKENSSIIAEHKLDEFTSHRLKKSLNKVANVLEVDSFYSPTPVQDNSDNRPYYPLVFLIVDKKSDYVLGSYIFKADAYASGIVYKMVEFFDEHKMSPTIHVRKKEIHLLLKDFSDKLDFKLKLVKRLPAVEKVKNAMFGFARSGGFR